MNFADDIFDDDAEGEAPVAPASPVQKGRADAAESARAEAVDDVTRFKTAILGRELAEGELVQILSTNETFRRIFLDPLDAEIVKMATLTLEHDSGRTRPEELKGYVIAFQKLRKFRRSLQLCEEHGERALERAIQALSK